MVTSSGVLELRENSPSEEPEVDYEPESPSANEDLPLVAFLFGGELLPARGVQFQPAGREFLRTSLFRAFCGGKLFQHGQFSGGLLQRAGERTSPK